MTTSYYCNRGSITNGFDRIDLKYVLLMNVQFQFNSANKYFILRNLCGLIGNVNVRIRL